MSYTRTLTKVGTMVGFGFGLFTAYNNFDPDAHQSETMDDYVKYLSELFTQIGMITIQTTSVKILSQFVGILCDNAAIMYQKHQQQTILSKLKEANEVSAQMHKAHEPLTSTPSKNIPNEGQNHEDLDLSEDSSQASKMKLG